jgi:hypothetical protein
MTYGRVQVEYGYMEYIEVTRRNRQDKRPIKPNVLM